jgi:hypothetical protein
MINVTIDARTKCFYLEPADETAQFYPVQVTCGTKNRFKLLNDNVGIEKSILIYI